MNRAPLERSAGARRFDVIVVGSGVTAAVMASLLLRRELAAPGRVAIVAPRPTAPGVAADGVGGAAASRGADRVDGARSADGASAASGAAGVGGAGGAASDWDTRVFALSRASERILTTCGVWPNMPSSKVFPYERVCVWDAAGEPPGPTPGSGSGCVQFDSAAIGEPNLGVIVEGRALEAQCHIAAGRAGAVFIDAGLAAIALDEAQARVRLSDGRELDAELLVAADGAESPTRRLLAMPTAGHAYHQTALVAHVRSELSHRNTAWQRFLPGGPLAFLPLPDGRSSIVWSVANAEAARLCALDPVAFGVALTAASAKAFGDCTLTTPVASFPLRLQYAIDYVRPRAVLVGDAAHCVHPLAGQGLNLGLLDCAALAEVLSAPGAVADAQTLRRYERWRRAENLLAAAALDGLERLFASDGAALTRLRIAGLNAVSRSPFILQRLAAQALGLRGDLPALVRGWRDAATADRASPRR